VALACAVAFGALAWWQARRARELAQANAIAIHPAKGQVLQIDRARGTVTIAHHEIPGFMQAMTMTFTVKSADLLDNIKPGDEVEFELEVTAHSVTIRSIKNSRSPTSE
jgi:Cu/Ag efflux protein CusF